MTPCKRCQSAHTMLAGRARGKQRYKCKDCSYHFLKGDWRKEKHLDKRKIALRLYLENRGLQAISRVLNVSHVTVLNWMRAFGHEIKAYHQSQPHSPVAVMELDEMWHFVKKKVRNYGFGLHWTEDGSAWLILSPEAGHQAQGKGYGKK